MAVGRIVAGIFILVLLAVTESINGQCKPDCTASYNFDKVEDPYNCTNYYMCYRRLPLNHPTPCPNGGTFSGGNCGLPSYPPCKPKCSGGDVFNCKVNCLKGVTVINDPSNCGTYYECNLGVVGPAQQCPASYPHFDGIHGMCVNDRTVCCEFTCEPVCDTEKTFIPDYYDSTRFYSCDTVGVPTDHFQCPPGENVDIPAKKCNTYPKWQSSCSASPSPVTPSSVVTSSVTPTSGCVDSMTCTALGYFPKCNYCDPEFFFCEQIGQPAMVQKCTGTLLFSPDPLNPFCILPSQCGI